MGEGRKVRREEWREREGNEKAFYLVLVIRRYKSVWNRDGK